jgi:glycosyltransferase involved in cell wall biosynthesis
MPGLDIIVVANGCTDNTAEIARSFGQYVRVICIPTASKHLAMLTGDQAATSFPRIYVDADVELGMLDVLALDAELRKPGVLAAAPTRVLPLDGCPWPVRCYYDIWSRLPEVRHGLFARGVVAVNEAGHRRIAALPPLMADDLAASLSFSSSERRIAAGARVIYHPPRRFADLLRRRVRAVTGVAQIERSGQAPPSTERTRPADLMAVLRDHPAAATRLVVFVTVTLIARLVARRAIARGDYTTWLRDESSRRAAASAWSSADRAAAQGRRPG